MKYEKLRILYEAKFNRNPYGVLLYGSVCFNTEIGFMICEFTTYKNVMMNNKKPLSHMNSFSTVNGTK